MKTGELNELPKISVGKMYRRFFNKGFTLVSRKCLKIVISQFYTNVSVKIVFF